ncbi:hypothetical protein [Haloarcula montana]|uniref:hypothetical protein n=1 Tax=Haloarcula montana TaxID=3111776 RepID=UPI002D79362E|nr:hypothetical protein [Haloarcula sp. GH36]
MQIGGFRVELQFVADNPNLTFIFFISFTLLAVLGARFSFYAYRNRQASDLATDARLWDYLVAVGILAVGFALLGIIEIVTTLRLPIKSSLVLAHVLVLAMAMRVLYRSIVPADEGDLGTYEKALTRAAVVAVAVVGIGSALVGRHPFVVAVMGISAGTFAAAGVSFGHRGAAETRVQGTVIDTLLRHLLPVLLFGALVPVVDLATLAGLDRAIVLHVQVVFVIMTATTLMTATIKLRQNLATL